MDFSYYLGYETGPVNLVVTSVFIGVIIASFAIIYSKRYVGNFVRKLIKAEALGEESAKTLSETGYRRFSPIRISLREGAYLRKRVKLTEKDGVKRYYIPKEDADEAEIHYDKKGTNVLILVVFTVIFIIASALIIKYYPVIKDKLIGNTEETTQVTTDDRYNERG